MGEKYPILSPRKVLTRLRDFGFEIKSQNGSHIKLSNDKSQRTVIVPNHASVPRGTLRSILKLADITLDDFLKK